MGTIVNKYKNVVAPEEELSKKELKEIDSLVKDAKKGNTTKFSELRK